MYVLLGGIGMKKVLLLKGLGCANCAAKMEKRINELDRVKNASVDFASSKLMLEVYKQSDMESVIDEATEIIQSIESNVKVINVNKIARKKSTSQRCECGHDHDHDHNDEQEESHEHEVSGDMKKQLVKMGTGTAMFAAAMLVTSNYPVKIAFFIVAYVLIGGDILLGAVKNMARGQVFDEKFLMTIATLGAIAIGEYPEGVAVMLFYKVGEFFQHMAVERSRKSIAKLMDIRPDYANLKKGKDTVRVSPEEVKVGDVIVVKPGEKVPLDGIVEQGNAMLDTSALTGESVPREASAGDEVFSGSINKNGVVTVQVTREFGESTVSKILDLVQNATSKKAPTENFITKFARYYTPAVVIIALTIAVIPPIVMADARFADYLYRALIFLVISCPCALVISIPLSFFGGIGAASGKGILIKGSNYLEALNNVEVVVFDKTGTLTKGTFSVTEIKPFNGVSREELLKAAACAESFSNHPIAKSIVSEYGTTIDKAEVSNYEELAGFGVKVNLNGQEVIAGNSRLMKRMNIRHEEVDNLGTVVHVAADGKYEGYIVISDEIKEDSETVVRKLKKAGVKSTVMLTGDNESIASSVASRLQIDHVHAGLLPDQKVGKVEELFRSKSSSGKLVFVGDGINDAPVLARADIGVAMGGLGSDAAIEAADVVLMTDEPSKLVSAIEIAKFTRKIVVQNIVLALGIKFLVLLLGALGMATMWEAVFADVGVALLAIMNAIRVLRAK